MEAGGAGDVAETVAHHGVPAELVLVEHLHPQLGPALQPPAAFLVDTLCSLHGLPGGVVDVHRMGEVRRVSNCWTVNLDINIQKSFTTICSIPPIVPPCLGLALPGPGEDLPGPACLQPPLAEEAALAPAVAPGSADLADNMNLSHRYQLQPSPGINSQ